MKVFFVLGRIKWKAKIAYLIVIFMIYQLVFNITFKPERITRKIAENEVDPLPDGADWSTCCQVFKNVCGHDNCTGPCPTQPPTSNPLISKGGDNAFFIESSGASHLNFRQACGVESLARLNPNISVYILMTTDQIDFDSVTMSALMEYDNVRPIRIDVDRFMAQTVLEHWYFCSNWRQGNYTVVHLSDALRLVALSRYGGYYFDLDFLLFKPISKLRNFVAAESYDWLANSMMHFEVGQSFVHLALDDFRRNYRNDDWAYNGPYLINRVFHKWCSIGNINLIQPNPKLFMFDGNRTCHGVTILSPKLFYPIDYKNWTELFNPSPSADGLSDWNHSPSGAHLWNSLSAKANRLIDKKSNQKYAILARSFCPRVYSVAPDHF